MSHVLLFDHPSPATDRLADALSAGGLEPHLATSPEEAARLLDSEEIGVVLGEVERVCRELGALLSAPDAPAFVGFEDFGAPDGGADDDAPRPFTTLARPLPEAEVLQAVRRALEHRSLVAENRTLRGRLQERFAFGRLVTRDARMRRILEQLETLADTRATLLLTGESGTGKTAIARAIHEHSPRASAAFVEVNCGALPAHLLEDELFGHAKGAFTGAEREREGKFAAADGGTLFLDEIGTAPPDLQVKLLRVLERGGYERLGENETRHADVRLVAATNADLEAEVQAGRFRADLYYRIQVVHFELPPLRERPGDIPLLAQRILERLAEEYDRPARRLSSDALAWLVAQPWPGNVRELEHRLERGVLLETGSELRRATLLGEGAGPSPAPATRRAGGDAPSDGVPRLENLPLGPLKEVLGVPERWLVERALAAHGGSRQETARCLGINRSTLFNKMRKYDLLSFPLPGADRDPEATRSAEPGPAA